MQIPSNSLYSVINFYKKELAHIYTESELQNIIRWVIKKQLNISNAVTTNQDFKINESDLIPLEKMCLELKANKPIQYVLGEAEFYRLKFKVNEGVLIPRPETEELVERLINNIKSMSSQTGISILDIGTGSGCIPVSIKKNIPEAIVYALDISDEALETAKYNAVQNNADVNFFKADVLHAEVNSILSETNGEKFDVIVSNPPYVLSSEKETLHERVSTYEPHLALFVDDTDPILFYRKIAELAQQLLKKGGKIYFECHANYTHLVQQFLIFKGFTNVCIYPDMAGLARFSEASVI